jgi:hypothetical protein
MDSDFEQKVQDAIENTITEFLETAEDLKGKHRIQAEELFPPSFMAEHTSFETVDAFLVDGDFDPDRDGGWDALADEGLDQHVRETTDFDDWAEMKEAAKEEWVLDQLRS